MSRNPLKRLEESPYTTPLPASPVVLPATEDDCELEQAKDFSLKDTETTPALDSVSKEDSPGDGAPIESATQTQIQEPATDTNPPLDEDTTSRPENSHVEESEFGLQFGAVDMKNDSTLGSVVQEPMDKEAPEASPVENLTVGQEEFSESPVEFLISDTSPVSESTPPAKEEAPPKEEADPQPSASVSPAIDQSAEIEALQARLKQVEQRFNGIHS
jgi:hypothetical protein